MERNLFSSNTSLRDSTSGGNGKLFTPTSSANALGKRGATDAGLDSSAEALSRAHRDLRTKYNNIERQNIRLQTVESEQQQEIEELKNQVAKLQRERQVLAEGEAREKATSEEHDKAWASERINSDLAEMRNRANRYRENIEQLNSENQKLRDGLVAQQSASNDVVALKSRLKEVEKDRNELREYKRRSAGLSIELEECKRRIQAASVVGSLAEGQNGGSGEARDDDSQGLRQELTRQAQFLRSAQSELAKLREDKMKTDEVTRTLQDSIKNLKSDNRQLHGQLERARREMESLTLSFPASSDSSEDYSTIKSRLTALTALHDSTIAELDSKDAEIASLQTRLSDVTRSAQLSMADLAKTKTEAERELRWAKEGRLSAERREQMARRELETMRESGSHTMPGGMATGDQSARVRQLETLVDSLKSEIEGMSRDSRDTEERIAKGMGLVKQSALDSAESRIAEMQSDIDSFRSTIEELTSANNALDAEVSDLMRRVASGEYNPATERCIELKSNPASKAMAVRTEMLDKLREENNALLDRLKVFEQSSTAGSQKEEGDGLVPRQSYERVVKDKEDMERAHAKRLLRLKEIFGNKSKEFLEAVYSLLGWRIKFDESGADIRLTSMYAPKGKMGLTLKFASQEGHFGTMQMSGAMSRGLEECRHFWIVERQSVPGFLAQVTTEMFEKTTVGGKV